MTVQSLDHLNICTTDLDASRAFYRDVVGLAEGARPPFDRPGAWMYANGRPVLHISTGRTPTSRQTDPFNHMAFMATDLDGLRTRLRTQGIAFDEFAVPEQAMHQVFFRDPDGTQIEMIFTGGEAERALRDGARVDATRSGKV
ncbi:MAG: VOC family protein [Burkholderiaceae bacterium]